MWKRTWHALSYYFAIVFCLMALAFTMWGARVHKILVCEEATAGTVASKEKCPDIIPGIAPYTYKVNAYMPDGHRQILTLKRTFTNYDVGQYVTVYYNNDRLTQWYVSTNDWRDND